jgi:hypothetical protein
MAWEGRTQSYQSRGVLKIHSIIERDLQEFYFLGSWVRGTRNLHFEEFFTLPASPWIADFWASGCMELFCFLLHHVERVQKLHAWARP